MHLSHDISCVTHYFQIDSHLNSCNESQENILRRMKCCISFKFASSGCIACCSKSLLIQVHEVHENGQYNSFVISDLLGFSHSPYKQCFDLGVQELIL